MPLSLTVKPGDRILVDNQKVEVLDIEPTVRIRVRMSTGKVVTITDHADIEVLPKVKLGLGKVQASVIARLVFVAPRDVRVLRENLLTREASAASGLDDEL